MNESQFTEWKLQAFQYKLDQWFDFQSECSTKNIFKKNMEQNQINGLIFSLNVSTEQMPIFFDKSKSLLISSIPETAGYIVQKMVVAATVW